MELKEQYSIPRIPAILFMLAAILTLCTFVIYRYIHQDYILTFVFGIALLPLCITLILEIRRKSNLFQKQLTLLIICGAIIFSCYEIGYKGLIYISPTVFIFFFLFNLKSSLIFSTLYACISLVSALQVESVELVLRFSVATFDCIIFAAIFAHIINKQRQALVHLANTDELTGALNRKQLKTKLELSVYEYQQQQIPASLLLIDIDFFKMVNDNFGHIMGDQLLNKFSQHIQKKIRKDDLLFRFGGEEFLILLPNTQFESAAIVAEDLRRSIEEQHFLDQHTQVTCSIGVADLRQADTLDTWLKTCDNLLYNAKNAGRNCVVARA